MLYNTVAADDDFRAVHCGDNLLVWSQSKVRVESEQSREKDDKSNFQWVHQNTGRVTRVLENLSPLFKRYVDLAEDCPVPGHVVLPVTNRKQQETKWKFPFHFVGQSYFSLCVCCLINAFHHSVIAGQSELLVNKERNGANLYNKGEDVHHDTHDLAEARVGAFLPHDNFEETRYLAHGECDYYATEHVCRRKYSEHYQASAKGLYTLQYQQL